jgi:hypothetical protein
MVSLCIHGMVKSCVNVNQSTIHAFQFDNQLDCRSIMKWTKLPPVTTWLKLNNCGNNNSITKYNSQFYLGFDRK